ncbi:MAG: putative undecaprenyl-phosphate N-acetylglucosaminyl 1-phosphate transferase [Verrucomicrobiae bacterium]|nr:putative undecaprenyl-phosphate N-acetylglucosaminyl 1-phosphate transferase [Verrucomicrobiae bacterium]
MNWILVYFFIFDMAFLLALVFTPIFKRLSIQWGYVDQPDLERKIHTQAMPLLGGVAVFGAFALTVGFNYLVMLPMVARVDLPFLDLEEMRVYIDGALSVWRKLVVLLVGGGLMVALGMYDDKHDLGARTKLAGQVVIALLVWAAGIRITLFMESQIVSLLLTVLWIVTITNALNFLDNMDGLCAGIGLVCALVFAFIAGMQEQYFVCVMGLALAGALLGFLPHNFKPASIFLGDAGSHFVGYMLAVLPVLGTYYGEAQPTYLPVLIPLLVLAVPLFDLVMVMWIRMRRGEPVYIGDRNHISHRLVRLGLPQSWAVTLIYLITLTMGLGATVLLWSEWTAALIIIVQSVCMLAIVTLLEQLGSKR